MKLMVNGMPMDVESGVNDLFSGNFSNSGHKWVSLQ